MGIIIAIVGVGGGGSGGKCGSSLGSKAAAAMPSVNHEKSRYPYCVSLP